MRLNWRCRSAWAAALVRNANDCVSTNGKGAERSASNIPTVVGVGYSLIPSIAPTRVVAGRRYCRVSVPKQTRDVASTSLIGARGSGTGRDSPLMRSPKKLRTPEHSRPRYEWTLRASGSYRASDAATASRSFAHVSSASASSNETCSGCVLFSSFDASPVAIPPVGR